MKHSIYKNSLKQTPRGFFKSTRFRFRMYQVVWIIKLNAKCGNAEAQSILGAMYSKGIGVTKDNNEAFKWFHKAANQGNIRAQLIIGARYAVGIGVRRNHEKALYWYSKAANQNSQKAEAAIELLNSSKAR